MNLKLTIKRLACIKETKKNSEELIMDLCELIKNILNEINIDELNELTLEEVSLFLKENISYLSNEKRDAIFNIIKEKKIKKYPIYEKAYHFPILNELEGKYTLNQIKELDDLLSKRRVSHYHKYSLELIVGEENVDDIINYLVEKEILEVQYHYNCCCVNNDEYSEDTEDDGLWLSQSKYNKCKSIFSLTKEDYEKMTEEDIEKIEEGFNYPEIPCCYSSDENEITTLEKLESYDRVMLKLIAKPNYKLDEI